MAESIGHKKTRSPAYPGVGLEEAIRKADLLYRAEDRHAVPLEAIAEHWEYSPTSSGVLVAVSALKQFGLLEEEKGGENRKLRLTDLALEVLLNEEASLKRLAAIRQAALNPKIHKELWDKYEGKLPAANVSIRVYLLKDRPEATFNKEHVDKFINQFRSTISFAKLGEGDTITEDEGEGRGSQNALLGNLFEGFGMSSVTKAKPPSDTDRQQPRPMRPLSVLVGFDDEGQAIYAHVAFDVPIKKGHLTRLAKQLEAMEETATEKK